MFDWRLRLFPRQIRTLLLVSGLIVVFLPFYGAKLLGLVALLFLLSQFPYRHFPLSVPVQTLVLAWLTAWVLLLLPPFWGGGGIPGLALGLGAWGFWAWQIRQWERTLRPYDLNSGQVAHFFQSWALLTALGGVFLYMTLTASWLQGPGSKRAWEQFVALYEGYSQGPVLLAWAFSLLTGLIYLLARQRVWLQVGGLTCVLAAWWQQGHGALDSPELIPSLPGLLQQIFAFSVMGQVFPHFQAEEGALRLVSLLSLSAWGAWMSVQISARPWVNILLALVLVVLAPWAMNEAAVPYPELFYAVLLAFYLVQSPQAENRGTRLICLLPGLLQEGWLALPWLVLIGLEWGREALFRRGDGKVLFLLALGVLVMRLPYYLVEDFTLPVGKVLSPLWIPTLVLLLLGLVLKPRRSWVEIGVAVLGAGLWAWLFQQDYPLVVLSVWLSLPLWQHWSADTLRVGLAVGVMAILTLVLTPVNWITGARQTDAYAHYPWRKAYDWVARKGPVGTVAVWASPGVEYPHSFYARKHQLVVRDSLDGAQLTEKSPYTWVMTPWAMADSVPELEGYSRVIQYHVGQNRVLVYKKKEL